MEIVSVSEDCICWICKASYTNAKGMPYEEDRGSLWESYLNNFDMACNGYKWECPTCTDLLKYQHIRATERSDDDYYDSRKNSRNKAMD